MKRGFIKLWRSCTDNELYFSEPFTKWQAWVDLLILANHKPNTITVRGNMVSVERGQVAAGEQFLSERWRWSRNKTRRFMSYLEKTGQTIQQKSHVLSIYSIVKWSLYQSNDTTDDTTERQQKDIRRTTPKNDKNVKKEYIYGEVEPEAEEEKKKRPSFKKPSLSEVEEYASLRKSTGYPIVSAETFLDYYESNGWKVGGKAPMRDWKASFRTWERNRITGGGSFKKPSTEPVKAMTEDAWK